MANESVRLLVLGNDVATVRWLNEDKRIYAVDDMYAKNFGFTLDYFDGIVFTGGADVSPKYYGEQSIENCHWYNPDRDELELGVFFETKDTHYHFGICRGFQLLAVANGHKLWQDVTGHELHGVHDMVPLTGKFKGKLIDGVTSVHHQSVRFNIDTPFKVLAATDFGQPVVAKANNDESRLLDKIIEAAWFEETNSFGVQGHPEYTQASKEYQEYVMYHLLEDEDTAIKVSR